MIFLFQNLQRLRYLIHDEPNEFFVDGLVFLFYQVIQTNSQPLVYHDNFVRLFTATGFDIVDDWLFLFQEHIHGIQDVERHIICFCLN